jgi:hypothetical protein
MDTWKFKKPLYKFLIALMGYMVIMAGNLRCPGHGGFEYMQGRILTSRLDSVTTWLKKRGKKREAATKEEMDEPCDCGCHIPGLLPIPGCCDCNNPGQKH